MEQRTPVLWLLIPAIVLAACAAGPAGTPTLDPRPTGQPQPAKPSTPLPRDTPKAVRVARDALAKRAGVPTEEVEVVDWVSDTFPLDNLGCPGGPEKGVVRPAMVVAQEVTLRVDGKTYVYRVRGRRAILCQGPD